MQKYYGTNIDMENQYGIDLILESVIMAKVLWHKLMESVNMAKVLWHWLNYRKCAYGNSIMASITSILESIIAGKVSGIHIIIESLIVAKI